MKGGSMLTIPIEKEIKHENKIINVGTLSLNTRQTICGVIGLLIAIVMYLVLRNWVLMVLFTLPFAAVLLFIAKPGENGKKAEEVVLEKAEEHFYHNRARKYRTKNRHVALLNAAYAKMRRKDEADQTIVRAKKKEERIQRKRIRRGKIRAIM